MLIPQKSQGASCPAGPERAAFSRSCTAPASPSQAVPVFQPFPCLTVSSLHYPRCYPSFEAAEVGVGAHPPQLQSPGSPGWAVWEGAPVAAGTGMETPLLPSPSPPPPLPALAGTQHLTPLMKSLQIAPKHSIFSQTFATSLLRKAASPKSQGMPTAVWADDSPVALLPTASPAPLHRKALCSGTALAWVPCHTAARAACPQQSPGQQRGHQPVQGSSAEQRDSP